ncbi:MAG: hypothetical protein ABSH34_01710 [Verrucomicrobiota bacterium]
MPALLLFTLAPGFVGPVWAGNADADARKLRAEVAGKGRLPFSAKTGPVLRQGLAGFERTGPKKNEKEFDNQP